MLAAMFDPQSERPPAMKDDNGNFFIDRDPKPFEVVLREPFDQKMFSACGSIKYENNLRSAWTDSKCQLKLKPQAENILMKCPQLPEDRQTARGHRRVQPPGSGVGGRILRPREASKDHQEEEGQGQGSRLTESSR